LRTLLEMPEDYEVLFLQGGASTQFTMLPMSFVQGSCKKAAYLMTVSWSEKANAETKLFGEAYEATISKSSQYRSIPDFSSNHLNGTEAYVHLTSNNIIYGTQWHELPETRNVQLISDMSSDIMSRPIDVSKFDMIYAGAQRNLGPSGVTIVIIKKDLLNQAHSNVPTMLRYQTRVDKN